MNVQIIRTPAGGMIVIPAADYDRLVAAAEDRLDISDAHTAMTEMHASDGAMPEAVLSDILDSKNPVAAWRAFRGLSQAQLASRAGIAQTAVARLERTEAGSGRPATRKAIALDAPQWALDA